ncbi:MAG: hypothetical protein EOO75_16575 [Myxococcales bacterium]|nr:MAG: hypothetical protein EOO75_16575 [Myxococcales bacterium]
MDSDDCQELGAAGPVCHQSSGFTGTCLPACTSSADCVGSPIGPACSAGACVQCVDSSHCAGNPRGSACNTAYQYCWCLGDSDCKHPAAAGPTCTPDISGPLFCK